MSLTHLDSQGHAHMVDVTDKAVTSREAVAEARVGIPRATCSPWRASPASRRPSALTN